MSEPTPLTRVPDDAWTGDPDTWPYTPPLHVYERLESQDPNLYWRMGSGYAENLLDSARAQIDTMREQAKADRGAWSAVAAQAAIVARFAEVVQQHRDMTLTPQAQQVFDLFAALLDEPQEPATQGVPVDEVWVVDAERGRQIVSDLVQRGLDRTREEGAFIASLRSTRPGVDDVIAAETSTPTSLLPRDQPREIATTSLLDHLAERVAALRHEATPVEAITAVLDRFQADLGRTPAVLGAVFYALVRADEGYGDEHDQAVRAFQTIAAIVPARVTVTGWVPGEVVPFVGRRTLRLNGEACHGCEVNPQGWIDSSIRCLDESGCGWGLAPF